MALSAAVTLVLVPPGRGRWQAVEVRVPPRRMPTTGCPLFPAYRSGQRIVFDSMEWRIREVRS